MTRRYLKYYIFVTLLFFVQVINNVLCAPDNKQEQGKYLNRTINILNAGKNIAKSYGHNKLKPIHILSALAKSDYGNIIDGQIE
ncbi:hypothetical protein PFMALIP_03243 [Plasmodium falciparum MaliPS096_E11]|uniref:Clp R domain-containing protein n=2 Tax=Plasmodium falciparum TaxID=5833 RepID=W7JSG8_PLAFO|nr:hypothetical protein PFMALIP_03243 [Plasmodium falciparum MaliPS096_E11]EWC87908.1 hypothetical protein PFNF54_03139 [Plasmodium falciparum NF54]